MPEIMLKVGRERSILRHHPWIFSGAIASVMGNPKLGETVDVLSSQGQYLAKAAFNPNSNIVGRIWTWDENEQVNKEMLYIRLKKAILSRRELSCLFNTDAMRLVHGESDGIPGLILDQYGDTCVVQFLTAGVEYWKDVLIDIILNCTGSKVLYERSDLDVRKLEGLDLYKGLLHGQLLEDKVIITENEVKFIVDIVSGHKTGFYLDQRDNRLLARGLSKGLKILDCFSYTGGFAINTLAGQAESVTLVDSSSQVLIYARENILINDLSVNKVQLVEQDVFKYLRILRDNRETFDLVILDPPKFAPTGAQAERAARGYKDINLLAFKLLKPGGILLTFSCSGGVSEELFQKIIAGAALDADVDAVILKRLHQSADHPVSLNFPEGAYLKGFAIQKGR
jgi:23S rRNA (cytosine1962-C5)-methyltransferase